ncbi:hypothetical protein [Photobacterium ganghwense]|uniref:hypothetical protein n=1 Tax=Photobacterium ganghwense TaxID=320778 RepID=UPI001A8E21EB|nr:hypothetical protein [Photobacterium ganghwense]QSV17217.1 hypothetical protein FH974_19965 [Photobacterium ganghwense]
MKKLIYVTLLLVSTFMVRAHEVVNITVSDEPEYQAMLEVIRVSSGEGQKFTYTIDMDESATFTLSPADVEQSSLSIAAPSDIPDTDILVMLDASVMFKTNAEFGLRSSKLKISSGRLPLTYGERIMVGGNRTNDTSTEIWLTIQRLKNN